MFCDVFSAMTRRQVFYYCLYRNRATLTVNLILSISRNSSKPLTLLTYLIKTAYDDNETKNGSRNIQHCLTSEQLVLVKSHYRIFGWWVVAYFLYK